MQRIQSCINSPAINHIHGGDIVCGGSHSCIHSESILLSRRSSLDCYGLKSCANVKNISVANAPFEGYISCSGQESCADSNIDIVNRSRRDYGGIICSGYLVCFLLHSSEFMVSLNIFTSLRV